MTNQPPPEADTAATSADDPVAAEASPTEATSTEATRPEPSPTSPTDSGRLEPEGTDASAWDGILLPTRRPPVVLSVVLFFTMLVQGLLDPIAFIIDGSYAWPNPIPFWVSLLMLIGFYVVQAAVLLATSRYPIATVVTTMVVYLAALFVLSSPSWVSPLQLAVIAALFLLGMRSSLARTLPLTAMLVVAQLAAMTAWAVSHDLTAGRSVGFVLAQTAGTAASLVAGAVLGLWWGAQTRRVAQMRAEAEAEQREHEERLARARESERARIAQELHDVAAQHIAGLLSLTEAALTITDEHSRDARILITEARSEARFAAASLYSALNELRATGQARAAVTPDARNIDELVAFWRKRDLRIRMHTSGAVGSLPAVVSTTAYRLVQEGLTNVAKHASGAQVDVTLRLNARELEIVVLNTMSRQGLPDTHAIGLGWGLNGLRERVNLLGGALSAGPTEAGGWRIQARIPVADPSRESAAREYVR